MRLVECLKQKLGLSTGGAAKAWRMQGDSAVHHAYWMYATPVNMQLGRDSYFLSDSEAVKLSDVESLALLDSLNDHFSGEGYNFYVVGGIWFLGLDKDPDIKVTHIKHVAGDDVARHMPQGQGALAWNVLLNEIQMLLFSHAVNQAREAQGLPVVNSLWCYGLEAAQ